MHRAKIWTKVSKSVYSPQVEQHIDFLKKSANMTVVRTTTS